MTRSAVAIIFICFIIALAIDDALGDWISLTGVGQPTMAEIEVTELGSEGILVDMMLDGINVEERQEHGEMFQVLSIPQADWTNDTGKPKLPVVRTLLSIPSNDNVVIQIEDETHRNFDGYRVYPVGKEVVRQAGGEAVYIDEEFSLDESFYSTNSFYPQDVAQISFSGHLRDQRLIQLEIRPIRYNPFSGELVCHSFLSIRLTYEGRSGMRDSAQGLGPLGSVCQYDIANYSAMSPFADMLDAEEDGDVNYPDNLTNTQKADYLIIAADSFYGNQKLRQLADWRAQHSGFDVTVTSTSRVYSYFGAGLAKTDEKIRSFVQYVYNYWIAENMPDRHIGYILLVGDVEFLPIHMSDKMSFDETIATDNWYACVSGDDLMPDIMLGRLPAKSNTELNIMIDKILRYEQEPLYGDWANDALLLLGTVESLREDMEYARDECLLPAGYDVSEVSALDGGGASHVVSEINKGKYIVDYAGHGWVNGWEVFQSLDIARLNNGGKLPAIFSLACSTSYFDHPKTDSLAEGFLKSRNGAIAFFGSSRLAAISNVGFGLSEAIARSHIYTLGEITMHTKLKLLPYSNNMELYNLLGDPALDLCAPRREPGIADLVVSPVDISFDPEEPKHGEQVKINLAIHNLGAADARNVTAELKNNSLGGEPIEVHSIPAIPAGSTFELETIWNVPFGQPQQRISASVYTGDKAAEHYRDNNDVEKALHVSLEADGWPVEIDTGTLSAPTAADIDGNGDMELLVQNITYQYSKLHIWNHDGQPVAGWPKTVGRSNSDSRIQYYNSSAGPVPAVGDLDGDGAPEIVSTFFTKEVQAWQSDGSRLSGWPVRTSDYATSSPVLADLDADGKLEVAFGLANGRMEIVQSDGSPFPGWPRSVGQAGHLFPAVNDIDGDGDLEIIALHSPLPKRSNFTTSSLYVWHHDGTLVSGWPVQMQGADAILPPAVGDMDGDGTAEIAAVSVKDDICRIYVWDHDGSLVSGWPIVTEDEIEAALVLADLDRDGDVELIAAGHEDLVYAWHHNGRRVFGWPISMGEYYWNSAPVLGNVDEDEEVEVIFTSYTGVLHAYKHDGAPVKCWPAITETRSSASPPMIADMDGDGKTELAYASTRGRIHMLSLMGDYGAQTGIEWNMLSHDQMNTGSYNAKAMLPSPPADVWASDLPDDKGNSIMLSWKLSPDDARMVGYVVYRSDTLDGRYSIVGKVASGTSTYTDNTVRPGVTYWYIVRTTDGMYLSSSSEPVSAYSINNFSPEPPSSIYAHKGTVDNTIDVWWLMGEEPDLAGYKVYSGSSSRVYDEPADVGRQGYHTLTGLTNGTTCYISVISYDTEGNESLYSTEVTAIPEDDDQDAPTFSVFYPNEVAEGTAFYVKCRIFDSSGVYDDSSGTDGQGVYVIWDNDGELSVSSRKMRMSLLSSRTYISDARIPGQAIGSNFIYQISAYDNDHDWDNADDRTRGISQEQTVTVVQSPSEAYNYPNPAPAGEYTDRTVFRYYVHSDADVKISIYDIAGKLVESLEDEAIGEGYNEKEWNISNIASGVYVYIMEIQPTSGIKKVVKKKLAIVK